MKRTRKRERIRSGQAHCKSSMARGYLVTFIHHFAGNRDPLSKALKLEAIRHGIKFKLISVEKLKGILGSHGATYKSFEVGSNGLRGGLSCRVSLQHVFKVEASCSIEHARPGQNEGRTVWAERQHRSGTSSML